MRALVTGATRGIGRAVAHALVRAGAEVVGTGRDVGALPEAERVPGVRYVALDLRSEQSIKACAASAGAVDLLVSNAGGSQVGPAEELPMDRVRALFEMNVFGTMRLTQEVLHGMRERGAGRIIGIASFAAVTPVPFVSSYAASKAALIAFHKGLRIEVAPLGIKVSIVAPFDVNTTIPQDVAYEQTSAYLAAVETVRARRAHQHAHAADASVVADVVMKLVASREPRFFAVAGRSARLTSFLARHMPERLVLNSARKRAGLPKP
jgi:short-subunit dehydrogenase